MLGSFGFRSKAFGFKASKLNPLSGLKRIFGMQGLVELGKSLVKVVLLGAVGIWLLMDQARSLMGLTSQEIGPALASLGWTFIIAVLVMSLALAAIAPLDVPAQIMQRGTRLRMSKRSAERRVGKKGGRTGRSRWAP